MYGVGVVKPIQVPQERKDIYAIKASFQPPPDLKEQTFSSNWRWFDFFSTGDGLTFFNWRFLCLA